MKFLFQLNHPAHFHLFKNVINGLRARGHGIKIAVRQKDILLDLVKGQDVVNVAPVYRKSSVASVVTDLLRRDREVYRLAVEWKPDLMVGTAVEITHVGLVTRIPSVFVGEDDARIVLSGALATAPFATHLLSPESCDNWIWNRKTVSYRGFQKLAYLHPKYFRPDPERVALLKKPYSLIRVSALAAYHDRGRQGFDADRLRRLVAELQRHGHVYITSERQLEPEFLPYVLPSDVGDIHHVLSYATLFVGDSQSMAMEAAMLGVPNIRMSDFAGKIGVLNEVEHRYKLTLSFKPTDEENFYSTLRGFFSSGDASSNDWKLRREAMLQDKISVADFMIWFFESYPESVGIMRSNRDFQQRFAIPAESNFADSGSLPGM